MKIDDKDIAKGTNFWVGGQVGVTNHRDWIIVHTMDLELALIESLINFYSRVNSSLDIEKTRNEIIEDRGPLSSLTHLTTIAFYCGLIGENTKQDLKKISRVRNYYAHDRRRKQLNDDPEMMRYFLDTNIYKENRDRLQAITRHPDQNAMVVIFNALKSMIEQGVIE